MYFPSLLLYTGTMVFVTPTAIQWIEYLHHKSLLLPLLLHSHIQTTRDRIKRQGTDGQAQAAAEKQVLKFHLGLTISPLLIQRVTGTDSPTTSTLPFSPSWAPSPPHTRIDVQRPSKPSASCIPCLFRKSSPCK